MEIGINIQKARKLKGLSQEDMANKLGVTRQCVSLWETDQTVPTFENLVSISKLLSVKVDQLLEGNIDDSLDEQIRKKRQEERIKEAEEKKAKTKRIFVNLGFWLAIASVVFSFVPVIGTMFAIAGTIFSFLGKDKNTIDLKNIIGIVLSLVFIVASIVVASLIH